MKKEIACFGAGCFWHVEYDFARVKGVLETKVGYMGGSQKYKNPSYEQVCTDKTGYAEVVRVTFEPEKISYEALLNIFWKIHNPTTLNRQGPDIGIQYRSVIFYYNEKQKALATRSKKEVEKRLNKKVVTEIKKAKEFYPAEEYHQKYFEKHGRVC